MARVETTNVYWVSVISQLFSIFQVHQRRKVTAMNVEFPADVREDIHILGLQLRTLLMFVIPSFILGILCLFLPIPVVVRLILLVVIPAGTFLWLFFELPALIRCRRVFKKEPTIRTSAEGERNIQEIITARETDGPFVLTSDQCLHIFLSVTAAPWSTQTESERDLAGQVWQQVIVRGLSQGCFIDVWLINDLEALSSEMERQEKEQDQLPEDLKCIGQARREYWTFLGASGFSRNVSHYISISADPFELNFDPKPKDKGDRLEKTKQLLSELAGDVIQKLRSTGAYTVVLSGEILRDVAARQLQPEDYRNGAVRGSDWVRPKEKGARGKAEMQAPLLRDFGRERGLPARAMELVEEKYSLRWLPLLYKTTLPLRKLWYGNANSVYIVPVLRSQDDETPGLAFVINELYAGFDAVYTVPMMYQGDDNLADDIERAMRKGYIYFVIPNPDEWSDEKLAELSQRILATAKLYGCQVDIALQYPDGLATPLTA